MTAPRTTAPTYPTPPAGGASASGSARAIIRPVLRAVIRRPGTLYHPLYLQGVDALETIEGDIQTLAESEGLPVYFWRPGAVPPTVSGGARALLVVPVSEAPVLRARMMASPSQSQQVVIWGTESLEALDAETARWVTSGLLFRPGDYARESDADWSMGPTLARAARDVGRVYNPVVLVGPVASGPLLAQEALIRLEAGGVPASAFVGLIAPETPLVARARAGTGVVVHLTQVTPVAAPSVALAVETLCARGVQVVIVTDQSGQGVVANAPALAAVVARGITLVLGGGDRRAASERDSRRAHYLRESVAWPEVASVLAGAPAAAPDAARLLGGQASVAGMQATLALTDTVQWIGMTRITGRLVLYGPRSLGSLDFAGGEVVNASILGDTTTARQLADASDGDMERIERALLQDRAGRMAAWSETHFAIIAPPGDWAPGSVRLSITGLAMEMARQSDEAPVRRARVGGGGAVWRATPNAVPRLTSEGERLRSALDGVRTTRAAAVQAGLVEGVAIEALDALRAQGAVERVSAEGVEDGAEHSPAHEVALGLLAWGMTSEALLVLQDADRAGELGAEGRALSGHLRAGTDPHSATADFRAAVLQFGAQGDSAPDRQGVLDATLNVALLDVRGGQAAPAERWGALRGTLGTLAAGLQWTARHAAIVAELALRSGDDAAAGQVIETLRVVPEHAALGTQLATILAGVARLAGG